MVQVLILEKGCDLQKLVNQLDLIDDEAVIAFDSIEKLLSRTLTANANLIIIDAKFTSEYQAIVKRINSLPELVSVPILFFSTQENFDTLLTQVDSFDDCHVISFDEKDDTIKSHLKVLLKLASANFQHKKDLSKLEFLNKELEKEHLKTKGVVRSVPLGVIVYDDSNTLEFMNHEAELLTGYQFSSLHFKSMEQVYKELGLTESFENIAKLQGDSFCRDVIRNRHKRKINVERKCIRITDTTGKVISLVDCFRDVSTDVELEELMEDRINERSAGIIVTQNITLMALASLAESRDNETGMHLERMRNYSRILAEDLKEQQIFNEIDNQFIQDIYGSSPLHDIGKVGIPDYVLLKPGKLTQEEWEIMKMHPTIGANTLGDALKQGAYASFLVMAREICYGHHEKYDGSGYPRGLKGEEIPLSARIVALADCYDALRSARVYKRAFTHEESKEIIVEKSGLFYDNRVVDSFLRCEQKFIETANQFQDEEPPDDDHLDRIHQSLG